MNPYKLIMMYAFRYAVNRQTSAIDDVMEVITHNISDFNKWEIENMISDINFVLGMYNGIINQDRLVHYKNYLEKHLTTFQ